MSTVNLETLRADLEKRLIDFYLSDKPFVEITNFFLKENDILNIEIYLSEGIVDGDSTQSLDLYVYNDYDFERNTPVEIGMEEFYFILKNSTEFKGKNEKFVFIKKITSDIIAELKSFI